MQRGPTLPADLLFPTVKKAQLSKEECEGRARISYFKISDRLIFTNCNVTDIFAKRKSSA